MAEKLTDANLWQARAELRERDSMSQLERAARWIDGTEDVAMGGLMNTASSGAEELVDGVMLAEAFSNVVAFDTEDGLVLFDVSHQLFAPKVVEQLRDWSNKHIHTAIYTHGHADHVTGAQSFDAEAEVNGRPEIRYVAHEAVAHRFDRYQQTAGYNGHINMRQFRLPAPAWPTEFHYPDTTYRSDATLDVGGTTFELRHARGETDDHTWAYVPQHKAICVGDLFIWQFPNAGNPQKVQRYAWDWAVALRQMASLNPELLLPAHGPAVASTERIRTVLIDTARALESLHDQTITLMNTGARLDDVIHSVRLPEDLANKPYLKPTYDEPEFVVRNLWRLYGGWYDGNPANLKPAADVEIARETAALAGGADALANRAETLAAAGELRLACHFAEMATQAEPGNRRAHEVRAAVYDERRARESSFMASGIFRSAMLDSQEAVRKIE